MMQWFQGYFSIWTLLSPLIISVISGTPPPPPTPGIIAFDCNSTHLDVITFDLTRVEECKPYPNVTLNEKYVKVQVLQRKVSDILLVRRCHVIAHTLMWHCGMHSHSAMANYDIAPMPVELSRSECNTLHDEGRMQVEGHTFYNVKPNQTTIVSHTAVGEVWGEGFCKGGTVTYSGYKYNDVVLKRSYTIQLQERYQFYTVGSEEIMSFTGLTCKISDRSCYDYEVGRVVWKPPVRVCYRDNFESLYEGTGQIVDTTKLGPHTKFVRITSSKASKFQLFTPLVSDTSLCGLEAWTTPYVGLYLVEYKDRPPFPVTKPLTPNVDLIRYIETKFMTFAYGSSLTSLDIVQQLALMQCKTYRETLLNRLHIIAATPSSANLLIGNRPGIYGRVAGEVVHILQCPAVEVTLRSTPHCSLEVPVLHHGKELYMDPRTRILSDVFTAQECSTLTPVMFRHGQTWVKMAPNFSPSEAPRALSPEDRVDFQFHRLVSYAQGGIYDPTDLQQLRDFMLFSSRREAMTSNILSGLEGQRSPRYDLTQVLHEDGWKALATDRLKQMWGGMRVIGEWVSGFIGVYFCIVVAKTIIGIIIRTFNIYKITGLSWKLCAGVWSVFAQLILTTLWKSPPDTETAEESAHPMLPLPHVEVTSPLPECQVPPNASAPVQNTPRLYPGVNPI